MLKHIVKTCLDPTVTLPVFYAVDLSRLPPVDTEHCDVLGTASDMTVEDNNVQMWLRTFVVAQELQRLCIAASHTVTKTVKKPSSEVCTDFPQCGHICIVNESHTTEVCVSVCVCDTDTNLHPFINSRCFMLLSLYSSSTEERLKKSSVMESQHTPFHMRCSIDIIPRPEECKCLTANGFG